MPAESLVLEVAKWREDPAYFAQTMLGVDTLWPKQIEILEAVRDCRRVAVPSCHESGKTYVASVLAAWWLLSFQPSKVITTAPTQRQVRDLLWSEIRSRHGGMLRRLGGDPGLGAPSLTHWEIAPDWFATGFATSADKAQENAVRFQGYHSPRLLVVLDEAGGIPREVWAAIDGLVTSEGSHVLAIGNPASGTEFEKACRSADWRVLRISAFDCPNLQPGATPRPWGVTTRWVEEMRRRWGEGSVVFQTKVLGLFPETSIDTLLSIADVERALARVPPQENKDQAALGVDVARFGDDETVIYVLRGPGVVAVESWSGQNLMKTAGRVVALAVDHGLWMNDAGRIAVDDTGMGGGVIDRLRELGWRVNAVNFGAAPDKSRNETKFANRRTELWWDLREWIRSDAALADLAPDVKDALRADLCAPKYEQKSDGRIALEGKDKIRARVGRSPDHGDALALAVAARNRRRHFLADLVASKARFPDDEEDERSDREEEERRMLRKKWGPYTDNWFPGNPLDIFPGRRQRGGSRWDPPYR